MRWSMAEDPAVAAAARWSERRRQEGWEVTVSVSLGRPLGHRGPPGTKVILVATRGGLTVGERAVPYDMGALEMVAVADELIAEATRG